MLTNDFVVYLPDHPYCLPLPQRHAKLVEALRAAEAAHPSPHIRALLDAEAEGARLYWLQFDQSVEGVGK